MPARLHPTPLVIRQRGATDHREALLRVKEYNMDHQKMENQKMDSQKADAVVAVFTDHMAAEAAIKTLTAAGFEMKNLSVVGKGYHTEEKVVGFYNIGDRIKFWGERGAFWGGLWGLFLGGISMTVPVVGPVFVLGYLGAVAISAIEGAVVVGGLNALGAALYSIGIPKNSVIQYEAAVKADGFLVMAHGLTNEVARAKALLSAANPSQIDAHAGAEAQAARLAG
jgi:heat induced stress protein YflT